MNNKEKIYHGPIHLLVTNLDKSVSFWNEVIGLKQRSKSNNLAEMGTDDKTLVILEPGAKTLFKNGYSGLYHVAIHVPNEKEFALILARLINLKWPISPTDHIMSKAIYMLDPDGITIEITLETPERFKKYNMEEGNFQVIDAEGKVRGATQALDIEPILALLDKPNLSQLLPNSTKIGHVHLYVASLQESYDFYQKLGFIDNLISLPIGFADLSAGGIFKHRMAMNVWQSQGAPQAPQGTAGMKYMTIEYPSKEQLEEVVGKFIDIKKVDDRYQLLDPSGNMIHLVVG